MSPKIKAKLELKITLNDKVSIIWPVNNVRDAQKVRYAASPPDGIIPYSHFQLFKDGKPIDF